MRPALLKGLQDGTAVDTPQDDSKATVTKLLERDDGEIDWSQSTVQIDRMVRAFDPWPGTFTSLDDSALKILDVKIPAGTGAAGDPGKVTVRDGKLYVGTGTGPLEITRLQLEGRQGMSAADFLLGRPAIDGAIPGGQSYS